MDQFSLTPDGTTYPRPNGRGLDVIHYYIVTTINGRLFPLASICQHTTQTPFADSGRQVVHSCVGIMTVLSDPANRFAIESKRSMATDYYNNHIVSLDHHGFPITQTCALLGATLVVLGPEDEDDGYKFESIKVADVHNLPYWPSDGLVAIDITNLDNIRYGIMTFGIPADQDAVDVFVDDDTVRAISAGQYVATYLQNNDLYEEDMIKAKELDRFPLIKKGVLYFSWPRPNNEKEWDRDESIVATRSLVDQCINVLVCSTSEIESFDMSVFELPLLIPGFKARLREHLSEYMGSFRYMASFKYMGSLKNPDQYSMGQLLALTFDGETQLNLVQFKGLTAEILESALKTEQLKDVTELSLCVDHLWSSPDDVLDAISSRHSLRHVCFLLGPEQTRDDVGIEYWEAAQRRPHFLKRVQVTFTGAYVESEDLRVWNHWGSILPPPQEVFPALNMMVVCKTGETDDGFVISTKNSFYLGHGLLTAEAFAARFLRWLPNVPRHDGYPFSVGPLTLGSTLNAEVRPVLAFMEYKRFLKGSWIVLVLKDATRELKGKSGAVKYAFVQLGIDIMPSTYRGISYDSSVEPSHLREVLGLREFLQSTAPHVDQDLVDRLLLDAGKKIAAEDAGSLQGLESQPLSTMNPKEACKVLSEVLEEAYQGDGETWITKGSISYL